MTAINSNHETVNHKSGTAGGAQRQRRVPNLLPLALIAVVALIVYVRSLSAAPLLDEQYILTWLQTLARDTDASVQRQFLTWRGLNPTDTYGVLTGIYLRVAYLLSGGQLFVLKFYNIILHVISACCVALITLRLSARTLPSLVAAIFFLCSPLSIQAVTWLGATGTLLATTLVLSSVLCYIAGRYRGFRWTWLAASVFLYLMALLSSANVWPTGLLIMLLELVALRGAATSSSADETISNRWNSADLSAAIMTPLLFVIITGAYFAATGLLQTMADSGTAPHPSFTNLLAALKKVVLPVNQQLYTSAHKQYFYPGLFAALAGIGFLLALWRKTLTGTTAAFCALWLLLSLVPVLGHLPNNKTFIGDAAFYPVLAPVSMLLALGFSGLAMILRFFPAMSDGKVGASTPISTRLGTAMVLIPATLLAFTYVRMAWKEQDFLRDAGKTLSKLQEQGKTLATRSNAPYVVLTTMPSFVSLSPAYESTGVAVFDGATMLMSAPTVAAGRLKDCLRKHQYASSSGRFQEAMQQIVELDLHFDKNLWGKVRNALELSNMAIPNIIHNPLASYDEPQAAIMLKSRAPAGPILTLDAAGLSPLDGDFLCVNAKVVGVAPGAPANLEFYWQTREMNYWDPKLRKVTVKVDPDNPDFVRYYLPLRTIGWTTNGPMTQMTLGFPAGSTAYIRDISVVGNEGLMPAFNFIPPAAKRAEHTAFANGFYKFPTDNDLGLCILPYKQSRITLTYDASQVTSASGVTFEVSLPDRRFEQPNSARFSGVTWRRFPVEGARGTFELDLQDVPQPGLIYVRAIAMDNRHNFVGFFSDDICINLSR